MAAPKKRASIPEPIQLTLFLLDVPYIASSDAALDYLQGGFATACRAVGDMIAAGVADESAELLTHDLEEMARALAQSIRTGAAIDAGPSSQPDNVAKLAAALRSLGRKMFVGPSFKRADGTDSEMCHRSLGVLIDAIAR